MTTTMRKKNGTGEGREGRDKGMRKRKISESRRTERDYFSVKNQVQRSARSLSGSAES